MPEVRSIQLDSERVPYLNADELRAIEESIKEVAENFQSLKRVILYGSKARGSYTEDSDVDIMFIFASPVNRHLKNEISDILFEYEVAYDVALSALFISEDAFSKKRTPFLNALRVEGIVIWSRQ
ncbi:MAG TPA: hypothetical protein DEP99_03925 [Nitrospiraceae bacterium]|nr:hypothetical protein [Nitrospiraceae bacterium]